MAELPVELVNPLQGTRSTPEFSRGNTRPLVQRPWSPVAWWPATGDDPWSFHPDLPKLRGLRGGDFQVSPQTGPLVTDPLRRASAYRLDRSLVTPYRLKTEFLRYRVAVDLVPSQACALVRFTWAEGGVSRLLFEALGGTVAFDAASGEVRGHGPTSGPLRAVFDRPPARTGGSGGLAWVEFDLPRGAVVEVKLALGSGDLEAELGGRTPDELAEEGAAAWNRLLGRFEVEGGTLDQRRTFYSCLYRVLCSRGSGAVGQGVFPLLALAYRDEAPGLLKQWMETAPYPEMLLAEALAKGLPGADSEGLLPVLGPRSGNPGSGFAVSAALERAYGDWCLARIAQHRKKDAEARLFDDRSKAWQALFDPSMGFFRPLDSDGSWTEGFNPLAWGGAFRAGSAWQGGWAVPHDPEGLISALGGPEVALARLDTLLALKPMFQIGSHSQEIPEMTGMAVADFGQYAHGLVVTHGILWHYTLAGRPGKTERQTRRVLDELYGPGYDGFCGDEGDGTLSAWFLWASLGLYPLCPGSPDYVLGSPLFPKVTVQTGDGRTLVIEAPGNDATTPVVRKRTLGNVVLTDPRVSQADLLDLGRLVCEMGTGD